jgi:hypothetical protein
MLLEHVGDAYNDGYPTITHYKMTEEKKVHECRSLKSLNASGAEIVRFLNKGTCNLKVKNKKHMIKDVV